MTTLTLRLYEDTLPAGCPPVFLAAMPRAIYVREGEVTVEEDTGSRLLVAAQASVEEGATTLVNGKARTRLWRWELSGAGDRAYPSLPSAPSTRSELKLEADVDLDPRYEWLMRCDRVGFPPGGVALTHVHQGPGIRICMEGEIAIETQGERHSYPAGHAWFELGHAPVLAPTTEDGPTVFVRCFLLPRALKGRSSIRYVLADDAASAKVQQYCVFAERYIHLPGL